jgi:hypothetical protein
MPGEQTARCFRLHATVYKTHNGVGGQKVSKWSGFMTMLCVSDTPDDQSPDLFEMDKLEQQGRLANSLNVERLYSEPGLLPGTSPF